MNSERTWADDACCTRSIGVSGVALDCYSRVVKIETSWGTSGTSDLQIVILQLILSPLSYLDD